MSTLLMIKLNARLQPLHRGDIFEGPLQDVLDGQAPAPGCVVALGLVLAVADLAACQQLEDDRLAVLPGIQRLNSTLVMKHVVTDRPLPA